MAEMKSIRRVETDDGISWYVEQSGSGPHIVLVASGEGDCHSFQGLAMLLSPTYTVTTFDMPGFSRTIAPPSALEYLTPAKGAEQIITLLDKLHITRATFYGSSSGGLFALALMQNYEERVERIFIHEVPMHAIGELRDWVDAPPSENGKIVAYCKELFANVMNENAAAWESLGPVVDEAKWEKEQLKAAKNKINWSVGGLMPLGIFYENVIVATEVGIAIKVLNCKHFPYVSITTELAEYIRERCK